MKAWQYPEFGGVEKLALVDIARPQPGAGDVLVRVVYCGVNPIDLSTMRGRFAALSLPHTPGTEVAGIVEELGAGVTGLALGQPVVVAFRLFCDHCTNCLRGREIDCLTMLAAPTPPIWGVLTPGGFAEYALVPARNLVAIPPDLPDDQACSAGVDGATAYHLVDRAGVAAGERVLVVGATGGVGAYAVQFAALRGATVWALGRGPEAAARLRIWGAAEVLDRDKDDIPARIQELSDGYGVDVALDPLGAATWPLSTGALAQGGRYATCGVLTGPQVTLDLNRLYNRQQQIIGATGASRGDLAAALTALAAGRVGAPIWRTYLLDEAPAALTALGEPGRIGKVLVAVGAALD
ncbi:MAG TPA: alcohol dehydrogenase catalytic domain-containing protein [Chloroflexia bacterium]|nr:alcohol dehydrogenase catalytic domain-containing protein [Chloroflexia bacterium]